MGMAHRFSGPAKPYDGLTTIRRGKVDWTGMARLIPSALAEPLRWRKPQRIFVNSMSDLFHESLSNEEIAAVFGVMAACPQHTFQVLTKRPERARKWFEWAKVDDWRAMRAAAEELAGTLGWCHMGEDEWAFPSPNVWLGTSVENQATANKRIPELLATPSAVRFISAEPLLGAVDLANLRTYSNGATAHYVNSLKGEGLEHSADGGAGMWLTTHLDWVIVGGESGPGARPLDVAWIRSIIEACERNKVPVFVKQLGALPVVAGEPTGEFRTTTDGRRQYAVNATRLAFKDRKGGDPSEWPEDLRVRQFPEAHQ
jgi:protein gp37